MGADDRSDLTCGGIFTEHLVMDVPRISAKEARRKLQRGACLLVCAYDTDERFRDMELEGAISWPTFQSRLASLPKDQEVVFYCA